MSIELPPTPATELDARAVANQLAYGFEKHKDDYWAAHYREDPDYYFKRMLGWQSEGGVDQAVYGLYAVPPSPWHAAATPLPETTTPLPDAVTPPVYGDIQDILAIVRRIEVKAELLATKADIAELATKQDIRELREGFNAAVSRFDPAMLDRLLKLFGQRAAPPKKTGKK